MKALALLFAAFLLIGCEAAIQGINAGILVLQIAQPGWDQ